MARNINLSTPEAGVSNGMELSFRAPCECSEVIGITLDGVTYDLVDGLGNSLRSCATTFKKDAILTVVIDTDNKKATLLNPYVTTYTQTLGYPSDTASSTANTVWARVKQVENDVAGKAPTSHTHTKSQIADFAHNHDDRYYTEDEIEGKLDVITDAIEAVDAKFANYVTDAVLRENFYALDNRMQEGDAYIVEELNAEIGRSTRQDELLEEDIQTNRADINTHGADIATLKTNVAKLSLWQSNAEKGTGAELTASYLKAGGEYLVAGDTSMSDGILDNVTLAEGKAFALSFGVGAAYYSTVLMPFPGRTTRAYCGDYYLMYDPYNKTLKLCKTSDSSLVACSALYIREL